MSLPQVPPPAPNPEPAPAPAPVAAPEPGTSLARAAVRGAAFLSGAAALVFETLWFRQAGLLLGNAVWSSSIVLASFMAGLAVGNAVAGQRGGRWRRPLRAYALLELTVGCVGAALVAALPQVVPVLVPALRAAALGTPALNAVRTMVAFALLVVPASAMGATLPVLVRALARSGGRFGWALGQLYGWNTLGAVLGALAGELLLISWLGVRGAGVFALALNATAAAIALAVDRGQPAAAEEAAPPAAPRVAPPWAALAAAAVAGGILLALEVVWFRLLLLTVVGTTRAFAAMLAVVLLGIAAGGLLASPWTRALSAGGRGAAAVALAAGACTMLSYAGLQYAQGWLGGSAALRTADVLRLSFPLMLPTCVLSGVVFTLLGEQVRARAADDARATGLLTLANTLGAMAGALLGGFVLLPRLGVEASVYLLSMGYAAVAAGALGSAGKESWSARQRGVVAVAAAAFVAMLAAFPFGLMTRKYLLSAITRWVDVTVPGTEVVAVREGLTETVMVTRLARWDTPVSYRLLTNAISMSAWDQLSTRYMRAFVYLPVALDPQARRALLISYGVGVTAKSLTDTPWLESIDVVDVSRDIVRATRVVYPQAGQHPLDDPRVKVHIEDGRFFLQSRAQTWDIITGEPPPPNTAGISTLYSKEYFELMRRRLSEGGVASYWLPVYQMEERDSKAITAGFCAAFPDCSLWQGWASQWILLGTRGARPASEEAFTRQWRDPRVLRALTMMCLERPEELGTLFVADADQLAEWTRGVPAVDDDHPHRITPQIVKVVLPYLAYADPSATRERFARSGFVRRMWPDGLRQRTVEAFAQASPVLRYAWGSHGVIATGVWDLHALLTRTSQRTPVLWLMGSDALLDEAARAAHARGVAEPELDELLGVSAMADRDYAAAEALFARAQPFAASADRLVQWRVLALCLTGRRDAAAALMRAEAGRLRIEDPRSWRWLTASFALPDAFGVGAPAP